MPTPTWRASAPSWSTWEAVKNIQIILLIYLFICLFIYLFICVMFSEVEGSSCFLILCKLVAFAWKEEKNHEKWDLEIYYVFFWVVPRRVNYICRCFGTLYLFHLHRQVVWSVIWNWDVPITRGGVVITHFSVSQKYAVAMWSTLHSTELSLSRGVESSRLVNKSSAFYGSRIL